ncbi:glycoside hydrolase family 44 protein [Serendipita vermifera MAFF 305830]|uniref:Glycoside hydrolase family 44 protein n=1 Tax=Serendipita vermifera MAFF 305830 TaxID=933852 RepID=A0A0C3B8X0_SERVB|nr:glycoside hydrolase family 44 protein [Serendipita vermifera MAFF 305830]
MSSATLRAALVALLAVATVVKSDQDIYVDDALSNGWQNWGWNTVINWAATDLAVGTSSISAVSDAYAAVSLKSPETIGSYAGLKFDIAADPSQLQLYFQSTADDSQSSAIPISAISAAINPTSFTTVIVDFNALPPNGAPLGAGTWDRINFQALGNGASYHLDNIQLLTSIVVTPEFLSAEPIANNYIAVTTKGAVNFTSVAVKLNNATIAVNGQATYVPPDTPSRSITYLKLAKNLAPGTLSVSAGSLSVSYILPAVQEGSVLTGTKTPISPLIYGVNWPPSASYIQQLGVTVSRWGGNAVTAYNPFGDFTNAAADWFYENRNADAGNANTWIGWIKGAGSQAMMTIPALDWVAKDSTSYSYPKTIYPDQQKFDPYNADAGNGLFPNGSYVQPTTDPNRAYVPWNTTAARTWLSGLTNKPEFLFIDNEIEIAHGTHQDMHPAPMSYDEELSRVVQYAKVAKDALPNAKVAAPSTCSWWFYWTSAVGYTDNAAHGNVDFLPWFLAQMKAASTTAGKRLLDYLDIHYYFQPDLSANDDAAKALRLRMTRSLWDPTYVDESWVGTNVQNHQPNGAAVWLIPRMKQLISANYPGTKLSISEWSSTADGDITGGLVTADVLGIFGRYGVDVATYWANPDAKGPVGLAYWLYRGSGTYFGNTGVQVNLATSNAANTYGVYAATEGGKLSIVIVNKDTKPLGFHLANVPTGSYFLRHFGGAAGVAKWQTNITLTTSQYIVVPAYTALFIKKT